MIYTIKSSCPLLINSKHVGYLLSRVSYKSLPVLSYNYEYRKNFLKNNEFNESRQFSHMLKTDKHRMLQIVNADSNVYLKNCSNKKHTLAESVVEKSGPLEPYLRLMRFHKPVGSAFLYWPFTWGLAAATPAGCLPDVYYLALFYILSVTMRSAGCTANDMWDKDIDSKVERTKNRPLANNDLTYFDALVLLGGQLGFGCLLLLQCNFPTVVLSAMSVGLLCLYPATKRFVPWPQFILGMAMNWTVLIGSPAINGFIDWSTCLPLYFGGICWTMVYDTFYAFQDMNDDKKLGVRSTALSFKNHPKLWLTGFSSAMISSFLYCGITNDLTWPYFGSLAVISTILAKQIVTLDINNREDCGRKFAVQHRTGFILFLGLLLSNLLKPADVKNDNKKETSHSILTSEPSSIDTL